MRISDWSSDVCSSDLKNAVMTRILHILDHSLPMHSGYTFRTRAILKAQIAMGWEVACVTGQRHTASGPDVETVDDLEFHRTQGEARGPSTLREWREDRKSKSLKYSH